MLFLTNQPSFNMSNLLIAFQQLKEFHKSVFNVKQCYIWPFFQLYVVNKLEISRFGMIEAVRR